MGRVTLPPLPAQAFRKTFERLHGQGRFQPWQVFADFCEMAAMAHANVVDKDPAREARYLEIVRRYERGEVDALCQMVAHVIDGLDPETDFLGQLFMDLELANHWRGQFFTPMAVARTTAEMLLPADLPQRVDEKGFITLLEPAAGSGAMVIAFAGAMLARGVNPQQHLHVTAIDVDATAAHMCYLQMSLLGIPGVVYIGDTLRMEMRQHLVTPMHYLGLWEYRLRRGRKMEVQQLVEPEHVEAAVAQLPPAPDGSPRQPPQLEMFAE